MVGTKRNKVENLVKEVPEFVSLSNDNRTLTFHPFSSSEYSSEIHASTYKCIAKNKAGIIASPEIDLRAGTILTEIINLKWLYYLINNKNLQLNANIILFVTVVDQEYELQVFPAYAYVGNTAVLKCLIPRFVKQYIQVISWMWGNDVLLTNIQKGTKTKLKLKFDMLRFA